MKQLTLLLTLLLIPTLGLFAAKGGKRTAAAPVQPASLTVSCSICASGAAMSISGTGLAEGNATLMVAGPYTALTLISVDNSGQFSVVYPTGLHFPVGHYDVSVWQGTVLLTTSFEIQ